MCAKTLYSAYVEGYALYSSRCASSKNDGEAKQSKPAVILILTD